MSNREFALFSDVSVDPIEKIGFGAYILVPISYLENVPQKIKRAEIEKILLTKKISNTSSTRLELQTALWAIDDCQKKLKHANLANKLHLFSDSQCVTELLGRRERLEKKNFISKKTKEPLKNADLYKEFYQKHDELNFKVTKVAGHAPFSEHDTIHRIFSYVDQGVRKIFNIGI